ncbi:hypothetical protein LZ31DRAFT_572851 [Colletotrichum somersetense]|nr:hypothetical protein LZ31DRAFT_572851 [Colletotrichum somersetense]
MDAMKPKDSDKCLMSDKRDQDRSSSVDWSDSDSLDLPLYTTSRKSGLGGFLSRWYGRLLLTLAFLAFVSTWVLTIAFTWRIASEQSRASCSAAAACPGMTGAHSSAGIHGSNSHHNDHQLHSNSAGEGILHLPGWRLAYNSSYCNGFHDPDGARARGCVFDPVQAGWVHGLCVDKELVENFINSHQWEWYDDELLTQRAIHDMVLRGFGNKDAFTIDDFHFRHCEYIMKLLFRSVIRQSRGIGLLALQEEHLEHCLDILINKNTPELRNAWNEHVVFTSSAECYERVDLKLSS